ncbi:MAG: rRNA maturation RNase YbeY [Bacteroidota bacterium]|jgi:rRNA maturation RNase YbeY
MAGIQFFYIQQTSVLTQKKKLKSFLLDKSVLHGRPIDTLQVIFCSDDYLLKINQDFLSHDYYTDIITFDLGSKESEQIEGEIYISLDRVKDNANLHGVPFKTELHRVIFHGVLHLLGFKDKKKTDQLAMRVMEDEFLLHYQQYHTP